MRRAAEHLFLCGPPGCGKSTVGRLVAASLGRQFVDVDDVVIERAGRSIEAIFAAGGEPAFRALEREALADAAERAEPAVIALGGGTLLDPRNRARIAERGRTIYLRTPVALLEARLALHGVRRPLLARASVGALLDERRPLYESADVIVDVAARDAVAVAAAVGALA